MEIALTAEALGQESEAEIKRWAAQDGARVRAGDLLAEVETGKAVAEVTAPVDGVLEIIAAAGAVVGVNQTIARIK